MYCIRSEWMTQRPAEARGGGCDGKRLLRQSSETSVVEN